ncbi:hypothetical protein F2A37_07695 [Pseudomonas chlororaphis]|uniref:STM4504/CBY_0614 family protein n=1 Tax=Pseudomonas chlororaphis TaxID=587753 RepID=UPI0012327697|nr:hypothetical protein [Pseudomonas chlororaphis]KAA5846510.1 hypothetical protein F2A37_07695 [Pseudomonas chlororaphis]
MGLFDIFSKRQKRLRGEVPDVYQYDDLPSGLRVQIVHIWLDVIGKPDEYVEFDCWEFICTTLCREYGVFLLPGTQESLNRNYIKELVDFFLNGKDVERVLDVVELSFRVVDRVTRKWDYRRKSDADQQATNAINELNVRFKEHGVGFQFESGEIIRIDSEFLHSEVIKPALRLLEKADYVGPQEEFLRAHEHYRHGRAKEALNECLKSFESLMKAICVKRGWVLSGKETASSLIKVCLEKELIPPFWQTQFTSLKSLLEGAVPTGRNNLAGHGQGASATRVPDYLVAYMLHMTGACLVFLAEAEEAL